ncbi:MAG: PLP-dependent aminotransferase family protein [Candidatus Cybelea sp.]
MEQIASNRLPRSRKSGLILTPAALSRLLGPWTHGKGTLRVRLKSAVEKAIVDGLIAEGTRLPSERGLAEEGGVSRSTIVSAYDLLEEDGLLERRRGSGSIVRTAAARSRMTSRRDAELTALSSGMILQQPDDMVDFSLCWPDLPIEFLPYLHNPHLGELHDFQCASMHAPAGLPRLRERIAQRYSDAGIPTVPDNIIVTTGSQQGLSLAASLLISPGETVAVEQPTYFVALDTFRTMGARLRAFPPGFADPSLQQEMATSSFRALYCIPTFQSPTGHVMSEHARRTLVNLAREHNVPILEDCALEPTAFSGSTPRSLAYLDPENVVSVGSLGLVFWPGLHVGWIRASTSIAARLGRLKVLSDLGTSVPSQGLALRVLDSFDQIAKFRQRQLEDNCDRFCQRLIEQLPHWQFKKPSGGLSLWVRLPFGDATSFAQFAARAGVRILPGSSMTVDGSCTEYLRLPLTVCPAAIEAGTRRLALAWSRYLHSRSHDVESQRVVF